MYLIGFPLLIIPFAIYNMIAFLTPGVNWTDVFTSVELMSGATWTVTAEDRLPGPDGRDIDCWVVETDYNNAENPPSRFWLTKATQQFMRQEARAPDGSVFRKYLLI